MNILLIVQARYDSKRLPGKVLKKINGKTLLEILLNNLKKNAFVDEIVVSTSKNSSNDALAKHVKCSGFEVFRGSENDVLDRFYKTAKKYDAKNIIRITADCPLIDNQILDQVIKLFFKNKVDYCSNTLPPTWPDGLDVEIFKFSILEEAWKNATSQYDREHVTSYMRNNLDISKENYFNTTDASDERWTVDEEDDLKVISKIIENFEPEYNFSFNSIMNFKIKNPDYFLANKSIQRNEGAVIGNGQKVWKRARKSILGGNMLLSKNPDQFLPEFWPSYYKKSSGITIWGLDGEEYKDMVFAVGQNILGYANQEIENAVINAIKSGNMTTLNSPEEVYLSEKLISLHPWAEVAKFARSGGEANAMAIRIARSSSKNHKVAVCGYHGWHDWYLAANLNNSNELNEHLMPGLDPLGVPENLQNTIFTFDYNDFEKFEKIVIDHDIGIVKMEVTRNYEPKNNFLEKIRHVCDKKNIILIFDECTSGFRETNGGIHKKYNVTPDIAMFGKAIGNGHAITAVIGKKSVMENAQNSFISSTFWTERIGPVAALKTLEIMEKLKSWEIISKTGRIIKDGWKKIAANNKVPISISGIDAICSFTINHKDFLGFKTYITQEMLKRGFLASTLFYASVCHDEKSINQYFESLDEIFKVIGKIINDESNIKDFLDGPISGTSFKRLN